VASSLFSAGVALTPAVSSASALSYTFATVPTAPTDIFMRAAETSGGDGVTSLLATPANSLEGAVKVVSGRVKVSNAYGSELLPLTLSATAQYYSANGWLNSTTDSITQLTLATSYTVGAGSSAVTLNPASGILAGGLLSIKLSKPSAGAGIATVTPTVPGYLPVIPGTATFGVYKNNNQFIYRRESY
jgi:MSHA biogenesis protein MshQ